MKKIFQWLGATGFLVLIAGVAYDWFTGDVDLSYSRSLPSGYEFVMANNNFTANLQSRMFAICSILATSPGHHISGPSELRG